jgi:hypothetical protein
VEQMQHQTLPYAPTSNEGRPNKDLLPFLFARGCKNSLTHSPEMPRNKNQRKEKKIIKEEIKKELKGIEEKLMNINELNKVFDLERPFGFDELTIIKKYFTSDKRWRSEARNYFVNALNYRTKYLKNLKQLIQTDRLYTAGLLESFGDLYRAVNTFATYAITILSNELRYKQVKAIDEEGLLGKISLTQLKIRTYNICDNLKDKWGMEIARYCTNNDNTIIVKLLEEEYKEQSLVYSMNIAEHLSIQELHLLKKKVDNGEKFIIYRAFGVRQDEWVRKGNKEDGELYYLQDAGTGLSYTLNKDCAYYFAHRAIVGDDQPTKEWLEERYYKPNEDWYIPTDKYIGMKGKELKEISEGKGIKAIVCEYECDPNKITGYFFNTRESEIMIKPEDLKVKHYEIAFATKIAERYWYFNNHSLEEPSDLVNAGAIENGLTAYQIWDRDNNKTGYIYAETEKIRDLLEEIIDCGEMIDEALQPKIDYTFNKYAVCIPDNINPFAFGNGLLEYMINPTDIKREEGKKYLIDFNERWEVQKTIAKVELL